VTISEGKAGSKGS